MALAPGTRLGSYEITAPLGAGGMGEVYRARDTRLGRDVAVKVLSAHFANDREHLARFEREARLLASLNHPNIATIHGIETVAGAPAIVMELIDGDTLAGRLRERGRLALSDALAIARQVAAALEAAHDRDIIHRDLKPANIKITPSGLVKVLDFGLATTVRPAPEADVNALTVMADAATVTAALTRQGLILGTPSYMSPEQARGLTVDRRTDIWAFGCVLFEMLTGRLAFPGATTLDVLAGILERAPAWSDLPPELPDDVARTLRSCLEKDAGRRTADIRAVRLALDARAVPAMASSTLPTSAAEPRARTTTAKLAGGRSRRGLWVAAALVCAAAAGLFVWRTQLSGGAESRAVIDVKPALALIGSHTFERTSFGRMRPTRTAIALSRDGDHLAFTARVDDTSPSRLYLRTLTDPDARPMPDTDGADGPAFSPDGQWIAFWAAGALRKIPAAGGPVVRLCDSTITYGTQWADDGTIVFARAGAVWRVSDRGGEATEVARPSAEHGQARLVLPHLLPGGTWLLFTELPSVNDWENTRVIALSLATGERKVLLQGATDARYVPSGHLLFMRVGQLVVAPFDAKQAVITGGEITVAPDVMHALNSTIPIALDTGSGQYTYSASGTLAYVTGGIQADMQGTLQWIGRDGSVETIPTPAPPRAFFAPRLSADGRRLLVGTIGFRDQSVWQFDFASRSLTRLTTEGRAEQPIWSHDGRRFAFTSSKTGLWNTYVMAADGSDTPRQLTDAASAFAGAWTPDDASLVVTMNGDIVLVPVNAPGSPQPLIATKYSERLPDLSPDGRWLTYVSDESGTTEVYVRSFPDMGHKRQVSSSGGTQPAWSRNGRKLVFLSPRPAPDRTAVMEADVTGGATLTIGAPRTLFELDAAHYTPSQARSYDLTPDASRFVFVHETYPARDASPGSIQVVTHWRPTGP